MKKHKTFNIVVIILVTLIAAGFGIFAGTAYRAKFIGGIFGLISGIIVAGLYLRALAFFTSRRYRKSIIWLLGTITAGLCGILSTTFIHILTITIVAMFTEATKESLTDLDGFFPLIILIAEGIGLVVGLLAGGFITAIYVSSLRKVQK